MGSHQRVLNKEVTGPDLKGTLEIVWRKLDVGNSRNREIGLRVQARDDGGLGYGGGKL